MERSRVGSGVGAHEAREEGRSYQARLQRFCTLKKTLGRFVSQSAEGVSTEVIKDSAKDLERGVDWLTEDILRC